MIPKTVKIEFPNGSKTKTPKKQPPKEHKITKNDQKYAKMGSPTEGYRSHFFVIFEHWGTPGHPHGPQSFQKRSKEASKRQFGVIFAPIFTHFRPIMPKFSEQFGFVFHMFFQTNKQTNTRTHTQQRTQSKGIPIVYSSGQQANNLHSKRAFLSSGQQANNLTAKGHS